MGLFLWILGAIFPLVAFSLLATIAVVFYGASTSIFGWVVLASFTIGPPMSFLFLMVTDYLTDRKKKIV